MLKIIRKERKYTSKALSKQTVSSGSICDYIITLTYPFKSVVLVLTKKFLYEEFMRFKENVLFQDI